MCAHSRILVFATLLAAVPALGAGQAAPDPSGHWEGTVSTPGTELRFDLDVARGRDGALAGTVGIPSENIKGLPLLEISQSGKTIRFAARRDQTFEGDLAADGSSISGTYSVEGSALPFAIVRSGEAHVVPTLRSAPVSRTLEGTWTSAADTIGGRHLLLKIANEADNTSAGVLVNVDQGSLQLPCTIAQTGSSVTLGFPIIGATYAATLNGDGTELNGIFKEGSREVPLAFQHAAPDPKP